MSQRPPAECERLRLSLEAYADDQLGPAEREEIEAHLAGCPACRAIVERHRTVDAMLSRLPQTVPSPEVFARVLAASRRRPADESAVPSVPPLTSRRLFDAPTPPQATARVRPARGFMPAATVVLLIAFTLFIFHQLGSLPPDTAPGARQATPSREEIMRSAVALSVAQSPLTFQPALPAYIPPGLTFAGAKVTGAAGQRMLDLTWRTTATDATLTVHETAAARGWPGFTSAPDRADLAWQVGEQAWVPLRHSAAPGNFAVGELRPTLALSVEADRADNAARDALRLLSLSLDAPWTRVRVKALDLTGMAIHTQALIRDGAGAVRWTLEAYVDPASDTQHVEVRGPDGSLRYVDISRGVSAGVRYAGATHAYALGTRQTLSGDAMPGQATLGLLSGAADLANRGELWLAPVAINTGSPNSKDMLLTTAPVKTHVYVLSGDPQALITEPDVRWNPGGPASAPWLAMPGSCAIYTLVELVPLAGVPAGDFVVSPPGGYAPGTVPATVSC